MPECPVRPMASSSFREGARRRWRVFFTIAAVIGIAVAFARSVGDTSAVAWPGTAPLSVAIFLWAAGLLAAAVSWGMFVDGPTWSQLAPGFLLAQLGKYIPGGVWQVVGQVVDAVDHGARRAQATGSVALHLLAQVIVAAVLSSLTLLVGVEGWPARLVLLAPLAGVLLHRPLLSRSLEVAARGLPHRFRDAHQHLPAYRDLLKGAAWSGIAMLLMGSAFAVLVAPTEGARVFVGVIGAFAAAWVVGFLALPVPAGLGVRELVAVVLLAEHFGTAEVLAASVMVRFVAIAAETVMALGARLLAERRAISS